MQGLSFQANTGSMMSQICLFNDICSISQDKKKYEVSTGSHKTAEDLIAIYTDFVERYPLIGIIDAISFKVYG